MSMAFSPEMTAKAKVLGCVYTLNIPDPLLVYYAVYLEMVEAERKRISSVVAQAQGCNLQGQCILRASCFLKVTVSNHYLRDISSSIC
jgi:hypothetical protein